MTEISDFWFLTPLNRGQSSHFLLMLMVKNQKEEEMTKRIDAISHRLHRVREQTFFFKKGWFDIMTKLIIKAFLSLTVDHSFENAGARFVRALFFWK